MPARAGRPTTDKVQIDWSPDLGGPSDVCARWILAPTWGHWDWEAKRSVSFDLRDM